MPYREPAAVGIAKDTHTKIAKSNPIVVYRKFGQEQMVRINFNFMSPFHGTTIETRNRHCDICDKPASRPKIANV